MERLGRVSYPGLLHPGSLLTGTSGGARLEMVPAHIGIPFDWLSDYEKFEAPDPADWTARGYAVVNIDARGSWDSEGDMRSHSCISFTKDLCLTSVTGGSALRKAKMDTMPWSISRSSLGAMAVSAWRATPGSAWDSG